MIREKFYSFAGLEFAVKTPCEWTHEGRSWLNAFEVESVKEPHVFSFHMENHLKEPVGEKIAQFPSFLVYRFNDLEIRYIGTVRQGWKDAYICAIHDGKNHDIYLLADRFSAGIGANTILTAMEAEHLIARNDGFVFHCSYIDHDGKAILFTAPSETGKSTQAELWQKHRGAEIINGDRAAVRLADGVLLAEGIPFAGSSQYCKNRSLPIEAIVYLAQAPCTSIRKLRGYEAFSKLWEGVSVNTWDKEDMERVSAVVQKAAAEIPVFYMPCTPDESAVTALEEALRKLVQP